MAIEVLRELLPQGKRALIIVPSVVLLEQWMRCVKGDLDIEPRSVLGGSYGHLLDPSWPVTIGVVKSVVNSLPEMEGLFDILIADECHRYGAPTFQRALLPRARYRLGLTATFERADDAIDEVLNPYFSGSCFRYGYAAARADGVIAPYSVLGIGVDLEEATSAAYDHAAEAMAQARASLVKAFGYPENHGNFLQRAQQAQRFYNSEGRLARKYISAMSERQRILAESEEKMAAASLLVPAIQSSSNALVFSQRVTSTERLAMLFTNQGVLARAYHSEQPESEREDILDDFAGHELQCVVAAMSLDEGVDVPNVDLGVVTAGTRQRRQMIQRMGRIVRKKHDGHGAAFIVLYANGTSEDPSIGDTRDHFGELWDHADNAELWSASELATKDIGERIFEWIWDPGPRISAA